MQHKVKKLQRSKRPNRSTEKEKKKEVNHAVTAESQGIVAQGNSNPYNTGQILSRLQMIRDPRHLADVEPYKRALLFQPTGTRPEVS